MVWPAIIGAGAGLLGNLAGGLFGQANQAGQNANQWAMAQQNYNNQKEFAQHGIRWKVEDAKAAGLHPLFALSGSGATYSPSTFVPGDSSPMGDAMSRMGQDVSRAAYATMTRPERQSTQMTALQLENAGLQNDLLRSQIARNNASIGPPMPGGGVSIGDPKIVSAGGMGVYEAKPPEVINPAPGNPAVTAGPPGPQTTFYRSGDGLIPEPAKSSAAGQDTDIMNLPFIEWAIRNRALPTLAVGGDRPSMAQVRSHWPGATGVHYHPFRQRWEPLFNNEQGMTDRYINWRNRQ